MTAAGQRLGMRQTMTSLTRWLLVLGGATMVAIGLGLLVLLTQAADRQDRYNQHYEWLVWANVVVAIALLLTIVGGVLRLWVQLRRGHFGAKLLAKLAMVFALAAVLPGALIYTVSYQFVSRSIENWFDAKVEGALTASLNLGRVMFDGMTQELAQKTRQAAARLAATPEATTALALEQLREQLGARDVALWTRSGRLVASAGQSRFVLRPDMPPAAKLREARQKTAVAWLDGLDESNDRSQSAHVKALAHVPHWGLTLQDEGWVLYVAQELPGALVANALQVQTVNSEYQARALAREGLRRMYIGTLTLGLFLAVLGAMVLAVLFGQQLAQPLLLLAQGMQQVARGDLSPKLAMQSKDELGGLTRSFADMTQQLADARTAAQRSVQQLDQARANLQTILDNLTPGVVVLAPDGSILSSNPSATRILRVPVAMYEGQHLLQLPQLGAFAQEVLRAFERFGPAHLSPEAQQWQQSFELHTLGQGASQTSVTLLARGALLPDQTRLLVFDDISDIVTAERAQAWGEVARRLAHEIKNPLTPIQLAAERLQHKLASKLDGADAALLVKSVRTIVDQVDAMKRLVNEFRDYARLPAAELHSLDLNALVAQVLHLYASEGTDVVALHTRFEPLCPPIQGDPQQLRQVVHNLLQNAQDACEGQSDRPAAVWIETHWHPARQWVSLSVRDTGGGFAPHILQRAFEPYVTTKAKGTGLGLAVVKKIADDHAARVELGNVLSEGGQLVGAQVSLSFKPHMASPKDDKRLDAVT